MRCRMRRTATSARCRYRARTALPETAPAFDGTVRWDNTRLSRLQRPSNMPLIDLKNLQQAAIDFGEKRGWGKYHSPKNLAMALSVEVAELVEIFQWQTEEQSRAIMSTDERAHVEQELADITIYLTQLVTALGVDLDAAVRAKMEMNARKYPAPDDVGN